MDVRPGAAALWDPTVALLDAAASCGDVLAVALHEMRSLLGADRADAGYVTTRHDAYRPVALVAGAGVACCSFTVPADDPLIGQVMATDGAVAVADVRADLDVGACRDTMVRIGTSAVVARRFELGDRVAGLMCFDWTSGPHRPDPELIELVDLFACSVLAPVLAMAGPAAARPGPDVVDALSVAEADVVRLAARGLSYREIAVARGTSVSTVDHQLQSARRRVGARNTAQLVELADGGISPLPNGHRWADTGDDTRARPAAT